MDYGKIISMGAPSELLEQHCSGTALILHSDITNEMLDNLQWKWFRGPDSVEIHTDNINTCIKTLLEMNIDLSNMTVRSQNLEDLFLKLTGKQLRA